MKTMKWLGIYLMILLKNMELILMTEEDRKFYKWALEKVLNFEANELKLQEFNRFKILLKKNDTFVFKKVREAVI